MPNPEPELGFFAFSEPAKPRETVEEPRFEPRVEAVEMDIVVEESQDQPQETEDQLLALLTEPSLDLVYSICRVYLQRFAAVLEMHQYLERVCPSVAGSSLVCVLLLVFCVALSGMSGERLSGWNV
jgi:hypothetical protein